MLSHTKLLRFNGELVSVLELQHRLRSVSLGIHDINCELATHYFYLHKDAPLKGELIVDGRESEISRLLEMRAEKQQKLSMILNRLSQG